MCSKGHSWRRVCPRSQRCRCRRPGHCLHQDRLQRLRSRTAEAGTDAQRAFCDQDVSLRRPYERQHICHRLGRRHARLRDDTGRRLLWFPQRDTPPERRQTARQHHGLRDDQLTRHHRHTSAAKTREGVCPFDSKRGWGGRKPKPREGEGYRGQGEGSQFKTSVYWPLSRPLTHDTCTVKCIANNKFRITSSNTADIDKSSTAPNLVTPYSAHNSA